MIATTIPSKERLDAAIDRFWETIPPVWFQVRGHVRGVAVEHFDITIEQFHILRHIRKGITSASELAEVKQISRPAISQAVELLVGKGLIARQTNVEDRRYIQLALTPDGSDLLDGIFLENRAWMLEKLAPLSEEELDRLTAAMETLKRVFIDPE